VIIENLKNLDRLPKGPFKFFCFPLRFRDADGSPVRAVAEVPQGGFSVHVSSNRSLP
jgi:arylformamidase